MIEFKCSRFERDESLSGMRGYVTYPIGYRHLDEMMDERGVELDHSTLNRWVVKYAPELEHQFRSHKRPVGTSWWLEETYVKIKGSWKDLCRVVDKASATVEFLLTVKRDRKSALRVLCKAIGQHGAPQKITIERAAPTQRRSKATMPSMKQISKSAVSNISTTLSNGITGQ